MPRKVAMNGHCALFSVCLLAFILPALPIHAQTAQSLDVPMDEVRLIRLERDAAQVIVGNPSIADVSARSTRLLVVTGKSYGSTNVIALDGEGRAVLSARLGVAPNDSQLVTVYRGTVRQSLHCTPDCQRMLVIGDDKAQFEQLAESVTKKFGVANAAAGGE
jgi:Flp pilus assembly secretin CpaC